jgi:hypothetical protein
MTKEIAPAVGRAVKWLLIMLLAEFVLGTLLTTVINYSPTNHSTIQLIVLVAHIIVGVGLCIGSLAHIFTSRSSHLLGHKPLIGFMCIIGAFIAGGYAAKSGNSLAVFVMAIFFIAAFVTYGLSLLKLKPVE